MTTTVAPGAVTMFPAFRYHDAPAAIEWLVSAFGLEKREVHAGPDDTIMHAELGFGGSVLMLGSARDNEFPLKTARQLGGASGSIYMYVPDPDAHHARAAAAGARIVYAPRNTDYGAREYAALDLEGNLWSFGTYRPGSPTA